MTTSNETTLFNSPPTEVELPSTAVLTPAILTETEKVYITNDVYVEKPKPVTPKTLTNLFSPEVFDNVSSVLGIKDFMFEGATLNIPLGLKNPNIVSPTLLKKTQYQIVPYNGNFYYFRMGMLLPKNKDIFEVAEKSFPILKECIVIIEKEVYYVPYQDMIRGLVRKSRKLELKRGIITYEDFETGNLYPISASARIKIKDATSPSSSDTEQIGRNKSSRTETGIGVRTAEENLSDFPVDKLFSKESKDNSGTGYASGLAESEAINLAFKEQNRTLLNFVSEEEGTNWDDYEVSETP
jgi:hypothetical protein